jgi:hypothetical protein
VVANEPLELARIDEDAYDEEDDEEIVGDEEDD